MGAILGLLRGIPVMGWLLIALGGYAGVSRWQYKHEHEAFDSAKADAKEQRASAEMADRAKEDQRKEDHNEIARNATKTVAVNRDNAAHLRTERDRLQRDLAARDADIRAARAAAASGGQATELATGVPAELFGQCTERVAALAQFGDDSRAAGQACQLSYDALTK